MTEGDEFTSFDASELYCPKCRRSQPVRTRLLLVLPDGNEYDYLCSVCGTSIGSKTDNEREAFSILSAEPAAPPPPPPPPPPRSRRD